VTKAITQKDVDNYGILRWLCLGFYWRQVVSQLGILIIMPIGLGESVIKRCSDPIYFENDGFKIEIF